MANRFFPNYPNYLITSRYGLRTMRGETKMHNGIDMTATNDGIVGHTDDITAHTGGIVESVGNNATAGNYIRIRTDPRTVMVYYHLKNKSALQPGQRVQAGQRLGYMGATGNATGPHLHWGIQLDGKWVDPEPYLDTEWICPVKIIAITLPVLKRGTKGESVRSMQQLLIAKGYPCGEKGDDGSFGGDTLKALQAFQTAVGLESDGSCGALTWSALLGQ